MFNEEEFAKLNFKNAKIIVPRKSIGDSGVAYRLRKREILREYGVVFDIFSVDYKPTADVKERYNNYNRLLSTAEDYISEHKEVPNEILESIKQESFWYNKLVYGLSEAETQNIINEAKLVKRLSEVDLAHTGHTIPYRMSRQEALFRMSVIDELKKVGVAFDVYSDIKLSKKDKDRADAYNSLLSKAYDILNTGESLPQDLSNQIKSESFWYNKVVLGISEEETQRMIEEACNVTSNQ